MKFFINYLKLEFKRAYKSFPKMIVSAAALLAVIGLISYCGQRVLYGNRENTKPSVAFVTEDTSKLISMATMLLQSSESVSSLCTFIDTDQNTADKLLADGAVIAAITIPDGFMHGIMHGENVPITISFADNMTSVAGLLRELSYTATRTLASSEAGIYAQGDFYENHNADKLLSDANYGLNEEYLGFIFSRNTIFKKVPVSATGNISVKDHYIAGALTLFLLMFSMSFIGFVMDDNEAFKKKIFKKINVLRYLFCKMLVMTSMYYLIYLILSACALPLAGYNLFRLWPVMLLICACLCAVIVLLFEVSPNKLSAIILVFIFTIASAIMSGCILPTSFLPRSLAAIGNLLPSTHIINVLAGAIGNSISNVSVLILISYSAVCLAAASLFEKKVRSAR